ncbi:MAG: Tm-1-like ATP-binding domain-containing protein [Anaerolineae bacterium]|nr:Tm-1-like ATP-binding domain-containing protein [Anaerolineae bacterium]
MPPKIAILASLDTKGREAEFLRSAVAAQGCTPLIVDTGVLGEPAAAAEIDRHRVAAAGGSSIAELIAGGDKTHALLVMAQGAAALLLELLAKGELGGVLSVGGSRGTALSTRVMQALPVGVPKLMVSTMASGENPFGPYTGTRDVTIMYSVADIQGLNAVTRTIFTNAAAAVCGMSRVGAPLRAGERPALAASMLGVSTALVSDIQQRVEALGQELIAFHAVGPGGRSMEELIAAGLFCGVLDVTPGEIVQELVHSPFSAGPDRMKAAAAAALPQVCAPGGVDFIIHGPPDRLPPEYRQRKTMQHTPTITLVRTSIEEMAQAGRIIAERLSASPAPAAMILPLQAFGWFAMPGKPLHDPQSDAAFIRAFKQHVAPRVEVVELDTHLNDGRVAQTAVELMQTMLKRGRG